MKIKSMIFLILISGILIALFTISQLDESYTDKNSGLTGGEGIRDGSGDYPPPIIGDWVISVDTIVENETIILTGNLTVQSGGSLTFKNVTLKINNTFEGQYGIEVLTGGKLYVYDNDNDNTTINDASVITTVNTDYNTFFIVRSNATLILKNSEFHEIGYISPGPTEGIWIESDGAKIENNLISRNLNGIILSYSNFTHIVNNMIIDNNDAAIDMRHTEGMVISNNTMSNNLADVWVAWSSDVTITNNMISNGAHGITYLDSSNGNFSDNSILNMSNFGFNIERTSNVTIGNNTIRFGPSRGIYLLRSSSHIIGNTLLNYTDGIVLSIWSNATLINNTIGNSTNYDIQFFNEEPDWSSYPVAINTTFNRTSVYFECANSTLTVQWYMNVKVIDSNNDPIAGANVEVKDINDDVIFNGVTGSDGYAPWIVSTEYIQNDTNGDNDGEDPGEKIYFTPHNVTVSKGAIVGYADPEPYMNESKKVVIKLPVTYTTYTITKEPLQGNVTVDGIQYPAPAVFSWLNGDTHTISVDSPESGGTDIQYVFDYWDDGGLQTHDVLVGTGDTIITAYYYTQFKPNVTLLGTDSMHTVTAYYTQEGTPISPSGNFNFWSDWVDEGTSLSFDIDATGSTGTERWHTYEDFSGSPWISVSSVFSATVVYYHQYNVTITTTGLISSYQASITATQASIPLNPMTYTSWNEWADADSTLGINETIMVSPTERYHTIDTFSWIVDSPIDTVVNYYHQYLVTITTTGLVPAYPATINVSQHGTINNPTTSTSWTDWADNSTTLSIEDTVTVSIAERYHSIDPVYWPVDSAFSVPVNYYHQYKPSITLIGLDLTHNVTAYHIMDSTPHNDIGVFGLWSDWCDEGTSLSFDIEATGGSALERWRTYENFAVGPWTSVSSAFSATVIYYHQYNVSITTTGLVSTYPATINATQAGNTLDPSTYTSWNDWIDAASTLSINETIAVSATERYHTIDTFSWIINSPIDATVNYYHQYLVAITTTGLDAAYPAMISVSQHGSISNPTTSTLWSDWADNSTTLSIEDTISVSSTERYHTIDTVSWLVDSALSVSVDYLHQYKPSITLVGLDSTHNVTAYHTKDGTSYNDLGIFNSWSDWCDEGTSLSFDIEATGSTSTERWRTLTDFTGAPWDSVTAAFSETVIYYHQYKPSITTTGLVSSYPATISYVQFGTTNTPTTSTSWSDWVDASSDLAISDTIIVSNSERYHTIDVTSWTVNSALTLNVDYYHQYKPTVITNGLSLQYPARINFTQHGAAFESTTSTSWSNWSDAGSDLNITGMIYVSDRERYRTLDIISWTVDSAFTATVNYIHQYKPMITLEGTDDTHTVNVIHVKDYAYHNDTGIFESWSDWVDGNSILSFDECTSGSPIRCTTDTRTWNIISALDATIRYTEKVVVDGIEEVNYKPFIALVFSIILLLVGAYVSNKKPLKFKEDEPRNRLLTFLTVVLPFVIAEAVTGVVSFLTGLLSVPPIWGAGMVVDLIILISGLILFVLIYKKKPKTEEID